MICTVPPERKDALLVPLNGYSIGNSNLDGDVCPRHPTDTGMGEALQHRARVSPAGIDDAEARRIPSPAHQCGAHRTEWVESPVCYAPCLPNLG